MWTEGFFTTQISFPSHTHTQEHSGSSFSFSLEIAVSCFPYWLFWSTSPPAVDGVSFSPQPNPCFSLLLGSDPGVWVRRAAFWFVWLVISVTRNGSTVLPVPWQEAGTWQCRGGGQEREGCPTWKCYQTGIWGHWAGPSFHIRWLYLAVKKEYRNIPAPTVQ